MPEAKAETPSKGSPTLALIKPNPVFGAFGALEPELALEPPPLLLPATTYRPLAVPEVLFDELTTKVPAMFLTVKAPDKEPVMVIVLLLLNWLLEVKVIAPDKVKLLLVAKSAKIAPQLTLELEPVKVHWPSPVPPIAVNGS